MKQKSVKNLYNQIAKKYKKNRSRIANDVTELPKVLEFAGNVKGLKILDLGCGLGIHAKKYLTRGASVLGIDVSEEMIKICKDYCNGEGEFFVADFENTEFDKSSFDLIIASFSLHYSNKLNLLFHKFYSWIKPNGRMIFSIYHPIKYFLKTQNFDFSESKKISFKLSSSDVEIFNYYHPIERYFQWFMESGFELVKIAETTIPKNLDNWPESKKRIPNAIVFEITKKSL